MKKFLLLILLCFPVVAVADEYYIPGSPISVHGNIGIAWINSWHGSDKSYPTISKLTPAYSGNIDLSAPKYGYMKYFLIRSQLNVDMRHSDNGRSASVGLFYRF